MRLKDIESKQGLEHLFDGVLCNWSFKNNEVLGCSWEPRTGKRKRGGQVRCRGDITTHILAGLHGPERERERERERQRRFYKEAFVQQVDKLKRP